MRNLTPEELKQMYDDMYQFMKKMDDDFVDVLKSGTWGNISTVTFPSHNPYHSGFYGISPTDVDAKGQYSYQEPEIDEQGTYYGYKVLYLRHHMFISPRYQKEWMNGELTADHEPSEKTMFGIHCTKRPDHPELMNYYRQGFQGNAYYYSTNEKSMLVKCALSGTIVETEQGFRAEHAQIVGVFINGDWQSYQDYQERSQAHSRPNPQTYQWEEEWYTDFNTKP